MLLWDEVIFIIDYLHRDEILTQIWHFNEMPQAQYTFFFCKQSIFDPRPENGLSFSKKLPQKFV